MCVRMLRYFRSFFDQNAAKYTSLIAIYLLASVAAISALNEVKCEGEEICLLNAQKQDVVVEDIEAKTTAKNEERKEQHRLWTQGDVDRAVQLVYPDQSSHKKLVLHEENVKLLQHIQEPIATVAVVGKYHTGKSFLLNQLMGKKAGFGVGPFVRPETMGIWMWGKPVRVKLQDGQQVALVFLDTEGFAATNISETYDAKVFAVATLLSSYLIYNSVKIIDQADIDYLELLSRRTQLFALKSQMSKAKWTDEFNHDLLNFPPLLWVVQDFVQFTDDQENDPSRWLNRLLASPSKDSAEHTVSLKAIFPSVDCHTLFLPATKKKLLQDLSQAHEDDLTEEYKQERDILVNKIRKGLKPKGKNGTPITGPEFASLLEILVEAANEGSLAQIPSRWNIFIEKLEKTAKEDCLVFYEGEMALLHKQYENGPIPQHELQDWHEVAQNKSTRLLNHLLFGLGHVVEESSRGLSRKIDESFQKALDMNTKKTMLTCSDVQRTIELSAEEELSKIALPVTSPGLHESFHIVQNNSLYKYSSSVGYLSNSTAYETYYQRLTDSLQSLQDSVTLKNNNALEQVLKYAVNKAVEVFLQMARDQNPRTVQVLQKTVDNARQEAIEVFVTESDIAAQEEMFQPYQYMLQGQLDNHVTSLHQENENLVSHQATAKVRELVLVFKGSTAKIVLPLNETDLNTRLSVEKERIYTSYKNSQSGFEEFELVKVIFKTLQAGLDEICAERRYDNMVAYSKEVEVPLSTSKKIVIISSENYDTEFAIKQYIRQICLLNLDEGKPKHWPLSLKNTIIDNFINTDHDIRTILASKRGLWRNIKGFLQWLLWLFGLF